MSGGASGAAAGGASARTTATVLVVNCGPDAAREVLDAFFRDRGWGRRERGEGRIDYERGSRRRTILLGALAGKALFLTAQIEIRAGGRTTEIRYRWGAAAGAALGGSLGRARAERAHQQTVIALEAHLEHLGMLVRAGRA
ncbi:hypothetical protein [Brachybacterium sp. AOP3-A1-3]|uniref:hypothetical protein n=1 Tax=Brachybacterium sp. AOP3-A1-3 TaxID=3457699 RepID=UPI004034B0C6